MAGRQTRREDLYQLNTSPIVLVTDDGERITCNRSVLAKSSPYFDAMFSSNFKEKDEPIINIKDVNGHALRMLVDSASTKDCLPKLDFDKAVFLIIPAAMLQFTEVVELCSSFLSHSINAEKSIEIFALADMLSLRDLRRQALSYILYNFSRIFRETHVFSRASERLLIQLLSKPSLCCKDEIEVFDCIITWLEDNSDDIESPEDKWPTLIHCLRFSSIDSDELRTLSCFPAVRDSPFLQSLIDCILTIKTGNKVEMCQCGCHRDSDEVPDKVCQSCRDQCLIFAPKPEESESIHESSNMFCCILPCEEDDEKEQEKLLHRENRISHPGQQCIYEEKIIVCAKSLLEADPRSPTYFPCVVGHIQLEQKSFSNEDAELPRAKLQRTSREPVLLLYNPDVKKLENFLVLDKANQGPTEATGYKLCALGKDLYLVGGEYMLGYSNWQKSVWKYDTFACLWSMETTLPQPRRHHSLCVMDQFIYVIGGFGRYRVILHAMDRYDTVKCQWQKCSPLPNPLYSSACCSYNGLILVFASQLLAYYPAEDYWESVKDITMPSDIIFTNAMSTNKAGIYLTSSTSPLLYRMDMEQTPPLLELMGSFENPVLNSCLDPLKKKIYSFTSSNINEPDEEHTVEEYDIELRRFRVVWQGLGKNDLKIEDFCPQYSLGCFPLMQFTD